MQIRAEQLADRLARGVPRIVTVHGDDPLLAQEAGDAVRAAARTAGHTERRVFVAAGAHFDWSAVLGAAREQSLFAPAQLVEIRIPSGKPGKDGSAALQRYAEDAVDGVVTLVQLPRLDWQQQKSAWFAALDAAGVALRVETPPRSALPAWLAQRLARQGQRVPAGDEGRLALDFFADRVEGNLLAAQHEIDKLALLHPPGEVGFEAIRRAVLDVARYDVGQLGDAIWGGHVARALRIVDGLRAEGESAVMVHWSLADDVRTLARVRRAVDAGTPLPLALKEARVWRDRERLLERVVPLLDSALLARWLADGHVCDGVIKGLPHPQWPREPWPALRRWVLAMVGRVAGAAGQGRAGVVAAASPPLRLALGDA